LAKAWGAPTDAIPPGESLGPLRFRLPSPLSCGPAVASKAMDKASSIPIYIFSFLCADTCQLTISNTPAKARYTFSCLLVKAKRNNSRVKDIVKQFLGSVSLERFFQTNTRFYLCLSVFTAVRLNRKILNSYSFGHLIPYRAKRGWIVP